MNANGQAVLGPMEGRSHLRLAFRREATSSRDSRVNDKAGKARREKPVSTCLTSKVACQSLAVTYVTTWHRAPSCAERTMVRPAALPASYGPDAHANPRAAFGNLCVPCQSRGAALAQGGRGVWHHGSSGPGGHDRDAAIVLFRGSIVRALWP